MEVCKLCGTPLIKKGRTFCSNKCSAKYRYDNNKHIKANLSYGRSKLKGIIPWNKGLTKETDMRIRKASEKIKETHKHYKPTFGGKRHITTHISKETKKKISNTLQGHTVSEETRNKIRKATIEQLKSGKMGSSDTNIERIMENWLLCNNILYVKQYAYDLGVADFWLPESNTIIECDGDYWHSLPKMVERDKKQNKFFEENDYITLRFSEYDIINNFENCIQEVIKNE